MRDDIKDVNYIGDDEWNERHDASMEYEVVDRIQPFLSTVYMDEAIDNLKARTTASDKYYPVSVIDPMAGTQENALFTYKELERAMNRGGKNPEDFEHLEHIMYDPHLLVCEVTDVLHHMTLWKLFKLWVMRRLGTVTSETIGRIIYGHEEEEEAED